jgi:type I restriction enzyme, S subunit
MSKWPVSCLRGKLHVKHGYPFKSEYFSNIGHYIVLTPGNFFEEGGFKRQAGKEKYYLGEIPKDYLHNKGDLIVAMTEQAAGLLGSCAFVPDSNIYLHNQRLGLITSDSEKLNLNFVFYLFQMKAVREQIRLTSTGSKVKHTSPERIYAVTASLPMVEDQRKIAFVLHALDAKIDCNNRINAELEAMAKTLYDYWFVQFEFPDANGKPYKSSGGKMVYNAALKREIPEGWRITSIGNFAPNIVTGKTPSKTNPRYFDGPVPFITIGDIRNNTFIVYTEESLSVEGANSQKNKYLPENAICVTCIASPGLVGFVTEAAQTNQQINSVVCEKAYTRYFLYYSIKAYFAGAKAKTGNTFANMNKADFSDIALIEPNASTLKLFHSYTHPIFECIKNRSIENRQLIKLRDWLLPLLLNGQVKVAL